MNEYGGFGIIVQCGKYRGHRIKNENLFTTFDVNPEVRPDHVCDTWDLKDHWYIKEAMKGGGFDWVVCDPEWNAEKICPNCGLVIKHNKGLGYDKRYELSFLLRDLLKVGGVLIMNNTWNAETKNLVREKEWKIEKGMANAAFITVYRRTG